MNPILANNAAVTGPQDKRVILPRKVVDALDFYKSGVGEELLFDIQQMVQRSRVPENTNAREIVAFINSSFENKRRYFEALLVGYKYEITPKERVEATYKEKRQVYIDARPSSHAEGFAAGYSEGIKYVNAQLGLGLEL